MDKLKFSQGMKILEEYYNTKLSDANVEIYWSRLKGYDNDIFKKAIMECIDTSKFFPKVVDIKELINGNSGDEAELAWVYLKEIIEKEGYYNSVSFPKYPATGAVVNDIGGGWCGFIEMMTDKEEKWIKKEFLRIYPIMKKRGVFPHRLEGRFELDNNSIGYTREYLAERYGLKLDGTKIDKKLLDSKEGSNGKVEN